MQKSNLRQRPKTVKFKIPQTEQHFQIERPLSDRFSTWETVQTFLPHDKVSMEPANKHESDVLNAYGLQPDDLLIVPPLKNLPSPFDYHSKINGDKSYVHQPRLSVSKLLTDAWCELRSFYEIYAGLPRTSPLPTMKTGTEYHARLELKAHPKREVVTLKTQIILLLSKLSPEVRNEHVRTRHGSSFAQNWMEQTVYRSICASHTKVVRELFIHGFLDLKLGNLVTSQTKLRDGVLVNGIADIVRIDAFNAVEYINDAGLSSPLHESLVESLPDGSTEFSLTPVLDLSVEIPKAKKFMTNLARDNFLHMRDVKTRKLNTVPNQVLAVNAAKLQCMYYAIFLHNLSRSAEFAYASCLENLKTRRIDPDEPISIALATEFLVVNFRVVALDCVRLAKGQHIGFQKFDEYAHRLLDYSLSHFVTEDEFRLLMKIHYGEELDISDFDLTPLFTNWKIPLTLRYVSARTGQAFNIYEAFEPSSVCVEYHNPLKQEIIARMHYPFDRNEIEQSVEQSVMNELRRTKMLDAIKGNTTLVYGTTSADFWTQVPTN
ncbi:hypothetical protein METBIDRAFT_76582 [Metschnikowia bicuspidata var. bicuspidata NRRL YB-4993]|uniref:Exonuclease V, mitochondrial n=1 Tax=Metschnikowia bicuspidata var. bicuspidata NRRL YB-4993 TaxID=869754 RepID=A0A1A0HID2_9ASCO|nr:hypothetical protein METBIDRAFT_76582 [Metschnikowia bicuspidata var. bicuspidata NRRL YB-4993]OBA23598.1 hypothetical protein METBIDRAFT_76582 [Metschnikowia bicuspidata var. bicuspidata NRRL YB-4993]